MKQPAMTIPSWGDLSKLFLHVVTLGFWSWLLFFKPSHEVYILQSSRIIVFC